ncbi:MAG: DNA-binding transcriptional ArsR family regulator [Bacteroidia bacterium]|jgi:DNA-binding transcriptional ArsR family regulator
MNESTSSWHFLSNHAHILICLATNPQERMRDVAVSVGITERAAMRIVAQLEEAGVLTRHKEGRRNRYEINGDQHLRHSLESHCKIGSLLSLVVQDPKLT